MPALRRLLGSPRRRHLATLLLGATLVAAACGSDSRSGRAPATKVVLITIDTLRPDHCSLYGYRRPTTPFLDGLAKQSTVFDRAYATSSWTAPSMASLFTSLPPRAHGVIKGFVLDDKVTSQDYLSDDFQTLAEHLSRSGWRTFGVSTNAHLTKSTGFAQGFDEFASLWWDDAAQANVEAIKFADRLRATDRWFLWIHYFDPHFPYLHQQPWFADYQAEPLPKFAVPIPDDILQGFRDMVDGYDSEIANVDDHIRRLFDALAIDPSVLVVVASDHGEAFYEHGTISHGHSLFEEEVRIPLLIRAPGGAPARRVKTLVGLADVFPTILDAVGVAPPTGIMGRSLLPAVRGNDLADDDVFTEFDRGNISLHALYSGVWKLYARTPPQGFLHLHDLSRDPHELTDLSGAEAERTRDLGRRWDAFAARWPQFKAPKTVNTFGRDQVDRLKALGYLGDD